MLTYVSEKPRFAHTGDSDTWIYCVQADLWLPTENCMVLAIEFVFGKSETILPHS